VGSGQAHTVSEVAVRLAHVVGKEHLVPDIVGKYRVGDIRHCFADVSKAARVLGYSPRVRLDDGLSELAAWLESQAAVDRVAQASAELTARGLTL
jgi:dTDP-L-rhamnose 4-epimerase